MLKGNYLKILLAVVIFLAYPLKCLVVGYSGKVVDQIDWFFPFAIGALFALLFIVIIGLTNLFFKNKPKILLLNQGIAFIILFAVSIIGTFSYSHRTTYYDNEIDPQIKSQIDAINAKVIVGFRNKDFSFINSIMLDELKHDSNALPDMAKAISENEYRPFRNYYCREKFPSPFPRNVTIFSVEPITESKYTMSVYTNSTQIYISVFRSNPEVYEHILAMVYVKLDSGWKLHTINMEDYIIGGMTIPQRIDRFYDLLNHDYDIPALLEYDIVSKSLKGVKFCYYNQKLAFLMKGKQLQVRVLDKYRFPIVLNDIESEPQIYRIENITTNDKGILLLIHYITKFPLNKEEEIKKESYNIATKLETIFKGITKTSNTIVFRAYPEAPVLPDKTYQYYGVPVDVNQMELPVKFKEEK